MTNFYSILGVPVDASPEEIRGAYFDLARKFHPDANPDPSAQEDFLQIQAAYEVLSNSHKRSAYDEKLPDVVRRGPEISVNVKFSHSILQRIDEQQLMYVLVDLICTAEVELNKLPPLHLCLVIDRSTSMQGPRMDMVKASANQLLRQFRSQDMMSVVVFSDRAEVVIPPTRMGDLTKDDHRVSMLLTGGGTEIYQGLKLGVDQLRSVDERYLRQLILLTDGHTYGDDEACLQLAEEIAAEGITINALGIGHEWNDTLMDKMASLSGGNAMFVSSPNDLKKFMEQKLNSLSDTYARTMALEFASDPDVQLRYAFRLHPDTGPLQVKSPVSLGTLQFRKSMSFLLEFLIPPVGAHAQSVSMAHGQIRMDIPSIQPSRARIRFDIRRPVSDDIERESPPSALVEAMAKLTLYRMQERVRHEVSEGQVDKATKHLHYLATHLLSQGDRELAHTVLVEAEHIQQSRRFSKEGDKQIKYGTRALLLPAGPEQKS